MTKEGMDWLIRPFYELTVVLFRCLRTHKSKKSSKYRSLKNESIFIVNEKRRRIVYYDTPSFFIQRDAKYIISVFHLFIEETVLSVPSLSVRTT